MQTKIYCDFLENFSASKLLCESEVTNTRVKMIYFFIIYKPRKKSAILPSRVKKKRFIFIISEMYHFLKIYSMFAFSLQSTVFSIAPFSLHAKLLPITIKLAAKQTNLPDYGIFFNYLYVRSIKMNFIFFLSLFFGREIENFFYISLRLLIIL